MFELKKEYPTFKEIITSGAPEKKEVIMYHSNGNDTIICEKNVWKIIDNYYVGEIEETNIKDYKICKLYAIYGDHIGFNLTGLYNHQDINNSIEYFLCYLNYHKIYTFEDFIREITILINDKNAWINNILIAFLKNIHSPLVAKAEEIREYCRLNPEILHTHCVNFLC